MTQSSRHFLGGKINAAERAARNGWRVLLDKGPSQFQFWLIALAIGIAAGFAALLFRRGIDTLQSWAYSAQGMAYVHSAAAALPYSSRSMCSWPSCR